MLEPTHDFVLEEAERHYRYAMERAGLVCGEDAKAEREWRAVALNSLRVMAVALGPDFRALLQVLPELAARMTKGMQDASPFVDPPDDDEPWKDMPGRHE